MISSVVDTHSVSERVWHCILLHYCCVVEVFVVITSLYNVYTMYAVLLPNI